MSASKSSLDNLIKAIYVVGGIYTGIELLKQIKSWFEKEENPEQDEDKTNEIDEEKSEFLDNDDAITIEKIEEVLLSTKGEKEQNNIEKLEGMLEKMNDALVNLQFERKPSEYNLNDVLGTPMRSPSKNFKLTDTFQRSKKRMNAPADNFHQETEFRKKRAPTLNEINTEFSKICITGGPCAGKTTAMASVVERLKEKGYSVFVVPEAATMIFSGGGDLDLRNYSEYDALKFQVRKIKLFLSYYNKNSICCYVYRKLWKIYTVRQQL